MGWMFALAEQAARRYGVRELSMVRTTAHAISDVLDDLSARATRERDAVTYGALQLVRQHLPESAARQPVPDLSGQAPFRPSD